MATRDGWLSLWPTAASLALAAAIVFALLRAPYAKVEESFNLHASHDLVSVWGRPLFSTAYNVSQFDHIFFPGVVPRTFAGPIALAAPFRLCSLVSLLPPAFETLPGIAACARPGVGWAWQIAVRAVLGGYVWLSWLVAAQGLARATGSRRTGKLMLAVTAAQFHMTFYASRTLPNVFALAIVNLGLGAWLAGAWRAFIVAFAVVIPLFRAEIVGLFGPLVLFSWLVDRRPVASTLTLGIAVGLATIVASVAVDSGFWRRTLWPEGEVLHFNTVLNKSSEWGTSPWHWYVTRALPKALLGALPGMILAAFAAPRSLVARLALPPAVFVALYSLLPHKELRFIFYVIPLFNALAAVGYNWALAGSRLGRAALAALLLASAAAAQLMVHISAHNYPGGDALTAFNSLAAATPSTLLAVHIDADAAMTGVSLFGQSAPNVMYSKTEGLTSWDNFTHLITAASPAQRPGFALLATIPAYAGLRFCRSACAFGLPLGLDLILEPALYILARET
ncbi:ALG12 protein [Thecamonas trahens ATCC 50062]|uniref:Mannosyltransferase n=1 Tax=Thecamonas trahens ATCC 50062 TaxID=461836 RepID=A0A0L0DM57_THETB|nr:ALG12 protein [Thecamonas trahens ATCC 50062]KNC53350.1 ALG12 protein [Thecamonas trahens ATCC 50062]|eukprot:XP_013754398.1 ALG12 protein [Thecamonas trahens ATCC 50062]